MRARQFFPYIGKQFVFCSALGPRVVFLAQSSSQNSFHRPMVGEWELVMFKSAFRGRRWLVGGRGGKRGREVILRGYHVGYCTNIIVSSPSHTYDFNSVFHLGIYSPFHFRPRPLPPLVLYYHKEKQNPTCGSINYQKGVEGLSYLTIE